MPFERPLSNFRLVEILQGDTMQAIAARELLDAERWVDIVNINGLAPPYLTGEPSQAGPTVKLFGQYLAVPAAEGREAPTVNPDLVFGVDVDLTGGRLSADNGDLSLVSGRANLRQALVNRLDTGQGDLLFHLTYGLRRLLGLGNGPTIGLLSAQYAKGAILSDERIASVTSISANVTGDVIEIIARVVPVAGAPIDLSATV